MCPFALSGVYIFSQRVTHGEFLQNFVCILHVSQHFERFGTCNGSISRLKNKYYGRNGFHFVSSNWGLGRSIGWMDMCMIILKNWVGRRSNLPGVHSLNATFCPLLLISILRQVKQLPDNGSGHTNTLSVLSQPFLYILYSPKVLHHPFYQGLCFTVLRFTVQLLIIITSKSGSGLVD